MAPSGSTFRLESLRRWSCDDKSRYSGKGQEKEENNITAINEVTTGMDASDIYNTRDDRGQTAQRISPLAVFQILAVSIMCCRARAPLIFRCNVSWRRLRQLTSVPMMNIVNGGCHALSSGLDVQEFMVMPVGAPSFKEGLRWCSEVFHALASILKSRGLATSVGDEGGFAPALASDEEAIETILEAVQKAGYEPGKDFMIAMDAASSEWEDRQGRRV